MSEQIKTEKSTNKLVWLIWIVLTAVLAGILAWQMLKTEPAEIFSPGKLTSAHHQITENCSACHTDSFGGLKSLDKSCLQCHSEQLNMQKDSHPAKKFADPRNADRLEKIDALSCVTCHGEHQVERDTGMAVTVASDFCIKCHADVDEERPTHKGFNTKTCATGGCHNYHDNSALYEDFLMLHKDDVDVSKHPVVDMKNSEVWMDALQKEVKALNITDMDANYVEHIDSKISHDWVESSHAKAGVNCKACHQVKTESNLEQKWQNKVGMDVCMTCHAREADGFLDGKHGMRIKQGLTPMTPDKARLPMNPMAHGSQLTCMSCHASHSFAPQKAAVESCLKCHADVHSQNYKKSKHFGLWHEEISGNARPGSGVSCATCHMPRVVIEEDESLSGKHEVRVEHNQSLNLRPNEKMVRGVCLKCHGLQFTLDALADKKLIDNNFSTMPSIHVESIDWAKKAHGGDR
jgi:predicted CXXCH cytochrome family protein